MTGEGMTEHELRAMVRESIARVAAGRIEPAAGSRDALHALTHASHRILPILSSGDDDGMCLIEPAVRCNHCGYCLSYGH